MTLAMTVTQYRKARGFSQEILALRVKHHRTTLAKVESGERPCPPGLELELVRENWRFALKIADERTGGWISNLLEHCPDMDLHPAALKEMMMKELHDLKTALEGLVLAKHIDPDQNREKARQLWHEATDVIEVAAILRGVMEEHFDLDMPQLVKEHEKQRRELRR